MKKTIYLMVLMFLVNQQGAFSVAANDTIVYLLTCAPGTETYSIYGHSALRVVNTDKHTDMVYNWGVFDFDTPNFAWKFAKGRLDYVLDAEPLQGFLQGYVYEKRSVWSQRINLDAIETNKLIYLINENLKPENLRYRYDFFYDDCTTRIRDLLEKSIGEKLLYPPAETAKLPTFREMVGKYQNPYPWLNFGVDLIMGSPGDKKAVFRDRMFLPIDMKDELSQTVINRSGKMIPLLQNPVVILGFDATSVKRLFFLTPVFLFTLIFVTVMIITARIKGRLANKLLDVLVFSVYSVLSVLMIFFNFFTDHQQMKGNLNIVWLNPVIIICLVLVLLNRPGLIWFRILFITSGMFLVLHFLLPQSFNIAIIPLVVILLVRSSARSAFDWNPLSIK